MNKLLIGLCFVSFSLLTLIEAEAQCCARKQQRCCPQPKCCPQPCCPSDPVKSCCYECCKFRWLDPECETPACISCRKICENPNIDSPCSLMCDPSRTCCPRPCCQTDPTRGCCDDCCKFRWLDPDCTSLACRNCVQNCMNPDIDSPCSYMCDPQKQCSTCCRRPRCRLLRRRCR